MTSLAVNRIDTVRGKFILLGEGAERALMHRSRQENCFGYFPEISLMRNLDINSMCVFKSASLRLRDHEFDLGHPDVLKTMLK
jgi:hypothetical protein